MADGAPSPHPLRGPDRGDHRARRHGTAFRRRGHLGHLVYLHDQASGWRPAFKGGLSRWPKLERELQRLLRDSSTTVLTTMFDYYAFPPDAPGMADRPHGLPHERVRHVESALAKAIGDERFLPNLVLHETEAWVLADCRRLGELMGNPVPAAELERIVRLESGPELVDDGVDTAPSKRIVNAYPQYMKTIDGPLVIADAGLDFIRSCCPHADDWLRQIEARVSRPATRQP